MLKICDMKWQAHHWHESVEIRKQHERSPQAYENQNWELESKIPDIKSNDDRLKETNMSIPNC